MKKNILKPIVAGAAVGATVFFTGPLLPAILVLRFIFTPFGMGRRSFAGGGRNRFGGPGMGGPKLAFADKVRSMSDEDYTAFKAKMEGRFAGSCRNQKVTL